MLHKNLVYVDFGSKLPFALPPRSAEDLTNCRVCAHGECQLALGSYEPSGALNEAVSEGI